jgi:hypothetical protein
MQDRSARLGTGAYILPSVLSGAGSSERVFCAWSTHRHAGAASRLMLLN